MKNLQRRRRLFAAVSAEGVNTVSYIMVDYDSAYKCAAEMEAMADAIAQISSGRADIMAFCARLMEARDKLLRETEEYRKCDELHLGAHYELIGGDRSE